MCVRAGECTFCTSSILSVVKWYHSISPPLLCSGVFSPFINIIWCMHIWKYEFWSLQLHRICSMYTTYAIKYFLFSTFISIPISMYPVSIRWKMVTMLQYFLSLLFIVFKRTDFSSYFISIWNFHVLLLTLSTFHCVNYLDCIHNTSPIHTTYIHCSQRMLSTQTSPSNRVFRDYLVKWFRYYHKLWSINIDDNNNNDFKRPFSIYLS